MMIPVKLMTVGIQASALQGGLRTSTTGTTTTTLTTKSITG